MKGVRNEAGEIVSTHKMPRVYLEMFMQIQAEYTALPNPKDLTLSEIRTYYEFISYSLKERSKKNG